MSDSPILIGVDVGTTNVKAAAYDAGGRTLAVVSRALETSHPQPEWTEYEPQALFDSAADTVRSVVARIKSRAIAGIAVSSMAETAVPVDAKGHSLRPAIAWHDPRTAPQAAWWEQHLGAEVVYSITGLPILPIFGINKLMWIKEHEPEVYGRIAHWLNIADYIAFRLCGVPATNLSLASRTMALDLRARQWSSELLSACDIAPAILCDLVPSGERIGQVHQAASERTGLPVGTAVMAGAMDHPCGALALGIRQPGDILDSMGTTESILTVLLEPVLTSEMARSGYQQGIHADPDKVYCSGGLYTAGAAVEWVKTLLAGSNSPYADLVDLANVAPPGSGGVFFLPHLRLATPPINDASSRAAFIGLDANTSPNHLIRAVIEGLAYEAQFSIDGLEQLLGFRAERLRAIGGGTRNALQMQVKAALHGRPIEISDVEEATTLGAAILAAVGTEVFPNMDAAVDAMQVSYRNITADDRSGQFYRRSYETVYRDLYRTLAPLHHAVAAMQPA